MRSVSAVFAVILPVSLGLGLIYLSSVGRIGVDAALVGTVVIVLVIAAAVIARDSAERSDLEQGTDIDR